MRRMNVCNLSFARSSSHPGFCSREITLNYSNMVIFNYLLYIDFKYDILDLSNLLINLKETERKRVYKIPPPFYGTDVNQQIWLRSLFLSVDYYFITDFDFKIRDLTHKKLAQGYSKTTPKNRMSLKTRYFKIKTSSKFSCSLALLRNHLLFSI